VAHPLIAIVGPTASGKSALALRAARATGGEIVSCDSQQVYRGLDIGTAKTTRAERHEVRHHLLDVVDPDLTFSAAEYSRLARSALEDIRARDRLPIVAGGTGLYLRALLEGLFDGPSRDEGTRRRLEALATRYGDARLHRLLACLDPASARRIQPRDRVRIVRAIEVLKVTGRTLSEHHQEKPDPLEGYRTLVVGLEPARSVLRGQVEERTRRMLEGGLLEEVQGLLDRGYSPELRPLQSIGYREAVAVLQGRMSPEEAEAAIVTATMRFAKRQMTWFRHQADVAWYHKADLAYDAIMEWLG
jgi:tRNA dimethylallyltransferase